jgi:hypothetical protein
MNEEFEITMDMLENKTSDLNQIHDRWEKSAGTIRFTINGIVSKPVHSSKEVGRYVCALIEGYNGYMEDRNREIYSAVEHGKIVICRLVEE